jgi:hypothetical protein
MAKMKHCPKNFAEANCILGNRDSLRLGNNTYLVSRFSPEENDKHIAIRLHNTDIVKFYSNGRITLHTGGWQTLTTADRINQFIAGRVFQKNWNWFYDCPLTVSKLEGTGVLRVPFVEGMDVAALAQ